MVKKIGCERKYNYGDYNIIVGTLDKKNPWIFYIEISTYISRCDNNYIETRDLLYDKLAANFKNYKLQCNKVEMIPNRNIVDIDIAYLNSKVGVRPHMTGKRFFCIKGTKEIHGFKHLFEILRPIINESLIPFITNTIQQQGFTVYKTKK